MSAFINDVEPSMVYAQMLYGYAQPNDVFIGMSTSGNSANVVNAATLAKAIGLETVALTGKNGGTLSEICDVTICVPETETYKVQELHLPVYHYLCAEMEKTFFGEEAQEKAEKIDCCRVVCDLGSDLLGRYQPGDLQLGGGRILGRVPY